VKYQISCKLLIFGLYLNTFMNKINKSNDIKKQFLLNIYTIAFKKDYFIFRNISKGN